MAGEARSGHCACGAVRFSAVVPDHLHACHCETCRRESSGASMTLVVPFAGMRIEAGEEAVRTWASSDWAARSFCGTCGSGLWFRMTAPDAATADYYLSAGLLDDLSGIRLTDEIYIDRKPEAWAFAGATRKMTGDEFIASVTASPEE